METSLTEAGPNERTLTVRLDAAEFEAAKDRAARRLSSDLSIKGFRPGKAPRPLVERAVGADKLRSEALDEALPEIVGNALSEAELVPATPPAVTATRDVDSGIEVDLQVTLWPKIESVPSALDRRVAISPIEVNDEDLGHQLEHLRSRFASLEEVSRPAAEGDYVLIDVSATHNGLPVAEAAASDLLYEIGSGSFISGMDGPLAGTSAGDIKQFPGRLPPGFGERGGEVVEARVLVKGVRAKRLPEVTDEWVSEVSEFESVVELEASLREELYKIKLGAARAEFSQKLLQDLIDEATIDLPSALVSAEMEDVLHSMVHRLESQGIGLETYLEVTGQTREEFVDELLDQAERNLRARIFLESVGEAEGIEIEASEVDAAITRLAQGAEQPVEELREQLVRSGQVRGLVGDMLRRKALDLLVERATPVDGSGNPVALWPEVAESDGGADPVEVSE